jgi:pimeloyl-ACP methyl ester carboxylesterase
MVGYIIGGFASLKWYYAPFMYLLKKRGLTVELLNPGPLGLNIWPLSVYEAEVKKAFAHIDAPIFLIGHSLGGIQAVWAAAMFPQLVKKIFAIGAPLYGSPWPIYEDGIRTLLDVTPEVYDKFRYEIIPQFASRLITISCPHDVMAPVEKCVVPGAKNYVVDVQETFVPTSHLLIPYLSSSLNIIQRELET